MLLEVASPTISVFGDGVSDQSLEAFAISTGNRTEVAYVHAVDAIEMLPGESKYRPSWKRFLPRIMKRGEGPLTKEDAL